VPPHHARQPKYKLRKPERVPPESPRQRTDILAVVILAEIELRLDAELMHLRDAFRERWRGVELTPPEIVYHYTDLKGFAGILGSGTIWATLSSRLNDEMELRHASAGLRRVLQAEAATAHSMFRHMLFPPEALNFEYARPDAIEVFVASLSSLSTIIQFSPGGDHVKIPPLLG